jgi:hypothetical protein
MTFQTTIRRQLFWGLDRRPLVVAATGAVFGAAATIAVIAGWSAFGPVDAAEAAGRTSAAASTSGATEPNYPASREGVRGPIDVDSGFVAAEVAQTIDEQPNYPASREGVRGPISPD